MLPRTVELLFDSAALECGWRQGKAADLEIRSALRSFIPDRV
jgi:hypothetical protein